VAEQQGDTVIAQRRRARVNRQGARLRVSATPKIRARQADQIRWPAAIAANGTRNAAPIDVRIALR